MKITPKELELFCKEESQSAYYKELLSLEQQDRLKNSRTEVLKIDNILKCLQSLSFWEDLKQASGHRSFKHKITGVKIMVSGHSKELYLFGRFAKDFCEAIKKHKEAVDEICAGTSLNGKIEHKKLEEQLQSWLEKGKKT